MKIQVGASLFLAICLAACSPEASKEYIKPEMQKTQVTQDPNAQYFDPSVDILFVVDNSGSMGDHQTNLASNISLFTNQIAQNSILDYHIGVVSTDMDYCYYPPCSNQDGALVGDVTKVVSNSTPNLVQVLSANLLLGTGGSGKEQSFAPIEAALTPPLVNGANAGFYRPTATLAVIFITDAEDQSSVSPQQLYSDLLKMKNGDAKKVLGYGVIVPTTEQNCPRDEPDVTPVRIETFLGLVQNGKKQGNILSLCAPDYGQRLADLAKDIVEQVGSVIYLNRLPNVNTIQVTYGSAPLPKDADKGWSFDPARNAIVLGKHIDWNSQPSGSRVMVNYDVVKTDVPKN